MNKNSSFLRNLIHKFVSKYWLYLRYLFLHKKIKFLNNFLQAKNNSAKVETIVVIGAGVSSYSFLKKISKTKKNYRLILISENDKFGGKCVHWGCMPSALTFNKTSYSLPVDLSELNFLSNIIEKEMMGFVDHYIKATVENIDQLKVYMDKHEAIPYDKVVICTGLKNNTVDNKIVANSNKVISIEQFWRLDSAKSIIINCENSKSSLPSLSFAMLAKKLGHQVTVLIGGSESMVGLPSFEEFKAEAQISGVKIYSNSRVLRIDPEGLIAEIIDGKKIISFDYLINLDPSHPNIPNYDSKEVTLKDFDKKIFSLKQNPNLYLLGEASGCVTASEAELQAELLAISFLKRERPDYGIMINLPVNIHGIKSLAMTGNILNALSNKGNWRELNFNLIGASLVGQTSGKIWYHKSDSSGYINAIHIMHKNAENLISIAQVLIKFPVQDDIWKTSFTHPADSEIFKKISELES